MTKAKAARASLAIILAVALTLCGILLFGNTAKAEETGEPVVTDIEGKYAIVFKQENENKNCYWILTSALSSNALEAVESSTGLPDSIIDSKGNANKIFTFTLNEDSNYYQIIANGISNDKNYLCISSASKTNIILGDSTNNGSNVKITKDSATGMYKIEGIKTSDTTGRYLSAVINKSDSTTTCKWYKPGSSYISSVYLVPVVEEDGPCAHSNTEIVGKDEASCTKDGYTGDEICSDCGETVVVGQVIPSDGHIFEDGICTVCGTEDHDYSGTYYFVAFRSSGNGWFMSNDLGTASTKRYQAIEGGEVLPSYAISGKDTKHEFTVVKNEDGTYKIYANGIDDDAKYLGWSSGNSGDFVTEEEALILDAVQKDDSTYNFTFIDKDGVTRYLSLNGTSGNNYFAWYKSGQKQDLTLIPVVSGYDITGAQVNVGTDLKITYRVEVLDGMISENDTLAMKFTKGGETVTVSAAYSEGAVYYFTIGGIAPHQMGDTIDAELVVIKDGVETTVDSKIGYSVAQNLINLLNDHADNEKLVALVNDMLAYGRAAQAYKNYNTGNVIGGDLTLVPTDNKPENSDKAIMSGNNVFIDNAGVRFDDVIKLYFTFKGLDDDTVVTVNGKAYTKADMEDMGGTYRLYTGALSATELDKVFNVTAGDATLTYSANAYAYSIQNNSQNENMKALALALYRYGISAKAYAAN